MKDIVVLYHSNCVDGFSAAWVARKKLRNKADYIPAIHQTPLSRTFRNKTIYFLDFAYEKELMEEIKAAKNRIILIDHHISAKEALVTADDFLYDLNHSGAVLAWKYFYPKKPIPRFLNYVEDIDLWKFKLPHTEKISPFMDMQEFSFEEWDKLYRKFQNIKSFRKIVKLGGNLVDYKLSLIKRIARRADLVLFDKRKIMAVNSIIFPSELGAFLCKKKSPMSLIWYETKEGIKVSLRSNGKVNVAKIAEKYGGGGHEAAAGFRLGLHEKLPWRYLNKEEI